MRSIGSFFRTAGLGSRRSECPHSALNVEYPGITHFAIKVRSIEATEVFLKEASIPITSRRHFMGVSSVFIHDPDNTVIEIVGEGPDVADLILAYEASQKEGAK